MRILSARIFSKSLAGKLKNFQQRLLITETIFQKKWRMRILSARIFSKSFGGKIEKFSAEVTDNRNYFSKKKRRIRILSARIFSVGKLKIFKQTLSINQKHVQKLHNLKTPPEIFLNT